MDSDLQEREAIFNALIEQAYNGIAVIQNGRLPYLNGQMVEIIGYKTAAIIDTPFEQYIHPGLDHVIDNPKL